MDRKIGILCAGDEELAPFLPLIENRTETRKAMLTIYEGEISGVPAAVLFSGVCKVNAAVAAQILIDSYGAQAIINAGTAGALEESLALFDTVVGTETAYHDVAGDILTEFHPWMESVWFPSDPGLLAAAEKAAGKLGIPVRFGRMVTGESFISGGDRERILAAYHPLTFDMESAAAAHVCYVNRIPFLPIRTVTDTADHGAAENFERNCRRASEISARLTAALLEILRETES